GAPGFDGGGRSGLRRDCGERCATKGDDASARAGLMIDLEGLIHVQGAVLWLPFTVLIFALSSWLYQRLNKAPFANPTLLTIVALAAILLAAKVPYKSYFEGVTVLHYLLGTAVVALALPLYRNADRLKGRCTAMGAALVAGSLASVLVGLFVAVLAHASAST